MAVIVPFESPSAASIDQLVELVAPDMERVNATILSRAQLDSVNIQDTRSFSYLTSSSYTDSAFGGPNIPRIRGQYGDVFINGMRSSFTSNGYGAFLSFNSIETVNITKGPASVIGGPGPGVGGTVDLITKLPNVQEFTGSASVDFRARTGRLIVNVAPCPAPALSARTAPPCSLTM